MEESPTSGQYCCQLRCCVTLESLVGSTVAKKSVHKSAVVLLGRNETKEIVLQLNLGQSVASYLLEDVKIFHKFAASEGRGCIQIPSKNLQILLSNGPAVKLNVFLKTLEFKLKLMCKGTPTRKGRHQLSMGLPQLLDKLSPLTLAEIRSLRGTKSPRQLGLRDVSNRIPCGNTPTSSKRTTNLSADDKPLRSQRNLKRPSTSLMDRFQSPSPPKKIRLEETSKKPAAEADETQPVQQLSSEQKTVVKAALGGKNLFFTGSAGTGKSFLLQRIIGLMPAQSTFVTAATGVAACQIGGVTLHSFAGIGGGTADLAKCLELALRPAVAKQWRLCEHLIIDEISMVDANFFSKLDYIAREVRRRPKEPFGGIQLILSGDFFQLPPVAKDDSKVKYCFESAAWRRCGLQTHILTEVRRQDDDNFIRILSEVRAGRCSQESLKILRDTRFNRLGVNGILPTTLTTHTQDAETVNDAELSKLTGEIKQFEAVDSSMIPESLVEAGCPRLIKLKVGAQVMLTKNLNLRKKLCNGSRGVVKRFTESGGNPVVLFASGIEETISAQKFFIRLPGRLMVQRHQIPIKLAWAISIHKSQGMTLDCAQLSLSKVFAAGQAYVALSRSKSLQSLRILDFADECIRADQRVVEFYRQISLESDGNHSDEDR